MQRADVTTGPRYTFHNSFVCWFFQFYFALVISLSFNFVLPLCPLFALFTFWYLFFYLFFPFRFCFSFSFFLLRLFFNLLFFCFLTFCALLSSVLQLVPFLPHLLCLTSIPAHAYNLIPSIVYSFILRILIHSLILWHVSSFILCLFSFFILSNLYSFSLSNVPHLSLPFLSLLYSFLHFLLYCCFLVTSL